MAVSYAEQSGATDSGYYLYSLISLGEIADKEGNKVEAKKIFYRGKKQSWPKRRGI